MTLFLLCDLCAGMNLVFLKMFNGYWNIEPYVVEGKQLGSKVVVTQEVLPSLLPPGPLGMLKKRSFHIFLVYRISRDCFSNLIHEIIFIRR